MRKFILILPIALLALNCTNKNGATDALLDAGYHPIKVGGYSFFGCSEEDFYSTRFKAYSSDSTRIVSGQVCEGLFFKGKTIRID
jgi:hypothetical protein